MAAKKHPFFGDLWLNSPDWLNTFQKLQHCRDMEFIRDRNSSGMPQSFIDWCWEYDLPALLKKDQYKKQVEDLLNQLELRINNIDRELVAIEKSMLLDKGILEEKRTMFKKALAPKKTKVNGKKS